MSEEIKIIDGAFSKDNPHKDIGKQKFRVRKAYTAWVEYDVVAKPRTTIQIPQSHLMLSRLLNVFRLRTMIQTQVILKTMKILSGLRMNTDGRRKRRQPNGN